MTVKHLIWTEHAIERVAERIGFSADIAIPKDKLTKTASMMRNGVSFRQRIGPVVYICKRDGNAAIVVSVVSSEDMQ